MKTYQYADNGSLDRWIDTDEANARRIIAMFDGTANLEKHWTKLHTDGIYHYRTSSRAGAVRIVESEDQPQPLGARASILQDNLLPIIKAAARALPTATRLPILNNIYLQFDALELTAAATDLELMIIARTSHIRTDITGALTVPGKTLADLLPLLPAERIDMEQCETGGSRNRPGLSMRCGANTTYLYSIDAKDFPILPTVPDRDPDLTLSAQQMIDLMDPILFASLKGKAGNDNPTLGSIHLTADGETLTAYAADGMILAQNRMPATSTIACSMPRSAADKLIKILAADVKTEGDSILNIYYEAGQLIIAHSTYTVAVQCNEKVLRIDHVLPIMPAQAELSTDSVSLQKINKRISKLPTMRIDYGTDETGQYGIITLAGCDKKTGSINGIIDARWHGGTSGSITLDPALFNKALTNIADKKAEVTLIFHDRHHVEVRRGEISVLIMGQTTPADDWFAAYRAAFKTLALPASIDAPILPYAADVEPSKHGMDRETHRPLEVTTTRMQWAGRGQWRRVVYAQQITDLAVYEATEYRSLKAYTLKGYTVMKGDSVIELGETTAPATIETETPTRPGDYPCTVCGTVFNDGGFYCDEHNPYSIANITADLIAIREAEATTSEELPAETADHHPITIEDNGYNVWVYGVNGNTQLHAELKTIGLAYAPKRDAWWIRAEKCDRDALTAALAIETGAAVSAPTIETETELETTAAPTTQPDPLPTPDPEKVAAYEERRAARIERLRNRADKVRADGSSSRERSRQMMSAIPFGQPIHVGHYSEKRDRNYRDRAWNLMGKGIALQDQAAEIDRRADAAEANRAISSDDPAAAVKLAEKIAKAERKHAEMKMINKIIRSKSSADSKVDELAALLKVDGEKAQRIYAKLMTPDFAGRIGVPDYEITNNSANIRRMKQRLEDLKKQAKREDKATELDGLRIVENADENRLQLFFDDKPDADTIKELKTRGFKWSRYHGAWQRHLNGTAQYAAQCVVKHWQERQQ